MLSINFYVYISPSLNCMNSGLSFVMRQSHFSFVGIEIPNGYCVSCTMWWLHLMRITSIWPEEYDSVEFWFDIGYCWSMLREYSGESTNFSNEKKNESFNRRKNSPQGTPTSHRIPVRIQIVYCGDDTSITIWIVYVQNVVRTVWWITCDHCLCQIMRKLEKYVWAVAGGRITQLTFVRSRILYSPNRPLSFIRLAETIFHHVSTIKLILD